MSSQFNAIVRTVYDVSLAIAHARKLKKAGHVDEAMKMVEDLAMSLAHALEDPQDAAIGQLVAIISEANGVSEADAYNELLRLAGEIEIEAGE